MRYISEKCTHNVTVNKYLYKRLGHNDAEGRSHIRRRCGAAVKQVLEFALERVHGV